jgi:polyisoprenoid-binding protein YceI
MKMRILRGSFVFHININHLFVNPEKVNSLYRDVVVKTPDLSKTHLTVSFTSARTTPSNVTVSFSHSASSTVFSSENRRRRYQCTSYAIFQH